MSVAMLMNITDSLLQAEGNEILQITLWSCEKYKLVWWGSLPLDIGSNCLLQNVLLDLDLFEASCLKCN